MFQGDYLRKISEKIMVFDKKFRSVQSGSSVNETNTPDPGDKNYIFGDLALLHWIRTCLFGGSIT